MEMEMKGGGSEEIFCGWIRMGLVDGGEGGVFFGGGSVRIKMANSIKKF